jgi:tetratricopeptide (TPR) repeat protein
MSTPLSILRLGRALCRVQYGPTSSSTLVLSSCCDVGEQRLAVSQKASGRLHENNNSILGQRLFFTSSERSSFNPLEASSATLVLKQADEELSAEELTLEESLKNYQQEKDDETSLPHLLEDLQQAYMDLGYWEEALGVERTKCADLFQPNTDEYSDSIHAQGKFSLRQEDFKNSKRLYEQALDYFTNTQNDVQRGHVLISLAGWYFFRDQLTEAMQHLQHLQDSEGLLDSNSSLLVKCLDDLGLIHGLWGEYDTALDKYRQALQVMVDDDTRQALNLHVADMLVALEEPDQALDVYQELLLETKASNAGMQGVLFHDTATIHVDQGDYELALEEEFPIL